MARAVRVSESNAYIVTFQLVDSSDANLALTSIATLTLTQYYHNPRLTTSDRYHLVTINNRDNQNVKNTNNVSISSTGLVTWYVRPEDTAKLNPNTKEELHIVRFLWNYSQPLGLRGQNSFELPMYVIGNA